jgi:hypothetical protein
MCNVLPIDLVVLYTDTVCAAENPDATADWPYALSSLYDNQITVFLEKRFLLRTRACA